MFSVQLQASSLGLQVQGYIVSQKIRDQESKVKGLGLRVQAGHLNRDKPSRPLPGSSW